MNTILLIGLLSIIIRIRLQNGAGSVEVCNNRSRLYSKSLSHFPMCSVKGSFVIAFISRFKKDKRQNVD